LEGLGALRFACTLKKCKSAKEASSIISKIEKLGGGIHALVTLQRELRSGYFRMVRFCDSILSQDNI
jgi:hypothetical protein